MIRILNKFSILLNKQQKRRIVIIVFLMLVGAILETLGVSLVVPLISALMQDDVLETNKYMSAICDSLNIENVTQFSILAIVALIIVFVVKDSFLYFEYYVQTRFISNNRVAVQKRLMEVYLNRPYEFFLNASSGEIMRVIRTDTAGTFNLLTNIMNFFTEAIVAIALVIAIIIVDPVMALLVATLLLVVMAIIYKLIKPTLRKAGLSQQRNNATANKWLLQAIAGVKEMKVANKETFFVDEYSKYAKAAVESEKTNTVLGNAPRLIIEAVTVGGMLGYIAIMIVNGKEISDLLPQLSAFAVAAVRLLPSANRMSAALNSIAYMEPQLDKTIENLRVANLYEEEDKIQHQRIRKQDVLSLEEECGLKNITFAYPNSEKVVLENANMAIPVGRSIGIIGASGAGKTTAVDILLGLLQPQKGEVYTDKNSIWDNYEAWLAKLAYIPQMIYMLDDTIRANVAFGYTAVSIDDERVWEALEEAQLGDFVRTLPDGIETTIGERGVRLSGGQRQRIGIARALYTNSELLIFDEATSALDNETEAAIMESINSLRGKKTMIIIAHRLTTIADCDLVYRVEDGTITLD
jgi:ABC-type multidrug transport system fused ATPase/permease subunit